MQPLAKVIKEGLTPIFTTKTGKEIPNNDAAYGIEDLRTTLPPIIRK